MNLQVKLGFLFGTLTFLLIVSSLLSYVLVRRIDSDVQNLGRVVAPLNEAVLEMQISISEGNKSIIQYSIDRDDRHIRRLLETKIEFAIALEEFNRLDKTDQKKEAGRRCGPTPGGDGDGADTPSGRPHHPTTQHPEATGGRCPALGAGLGGTGPRASTPGVGPAGTAATGRLGATAAMVSTALASLCCTPRPPRQLWRGGRSDRREADKRRGVHAP